MKHSIKEELLQHILDRINDGVIDNTNIEDWHFYCFNEDYYIIGYYQASQWLEAHNIDTFEAIGICQEYEKDHFGEYTDRYDNSETTVNMLAYIWGDEILAELNADNIDELRHEIEMELS